MGQYSSSPHKEPTMGWSQSSSIHPLDLAGAPEIERLRAEHKMELEQMSTAFKTALALKNRKIKDLFAELKEVKNGGMNEGREDNLEGRIIRDEMEPLVQSRVPSLPRDNAPALQARPRDDSVRNGHDEERSLYVYIFFFIVVAFSVMIGIVMHCLLFI